MPRWLNLRDRDHALDPGWKGVLGLKMLSRSGYEPSWERQAPLAVTYVMQQAHFKKHQYILDHILAKHQDLHLNFDSMLDSSKLIGLLSNLHIEILSKFKGIFHHF